MVKCHIASDLAKSFRIISFAPHFLSL
jgi:hypothetical protein